MFYKNQIYFKSNAEGKVPFSQPGWAFSRRRSRPLAQQRSVTGRGGCSGGALRCLSRPPPAPPRFSPERSRGETSRGRRGEQQRQLWGGKNELPGGTRPPPFPSFFLVLFYFDLFPSFSNARTAHGQREPGDARLRPPGPRGGCGHPRHGPGHPPQQRGRARRLCPVPGTAAAALGGHGGTAGRLLSPVQRPRASSPALGRLRGRAPRRVCCRELGRGVSAEGSSQRGVSLPRGAPPGELPTTPSCRIDAEGKPGPAAPLRALPVGFRPLRTPLPAVGAGRGSRTAHGEHG